MINKILLIALLTYSVFRLTGCCKAECFDGDVSVSFQNYTAYETDTVIFVGTTGNPSGTYSKDTFALIMPATAVDTGKSILSRTLQRHDTWFVTIPSVNKQFQLKDFEYEKQECMCSNKKVDALKSYTVNGVRETGAYYVLPR